MLTVKQHMKPLFAISLSQNALVSGGQDKFISLTDLAYSTGPGRQLTQQ